ncbi:hypothetical protein PFISCL1PPCAC_6056 [Pristionchus fissidentatus]|uniref:Uncharacterized protein n=1 Tax=Pristionchus fissidentatus TaxID=1538716 RepID=A0AAV5V8F0_9BILA|nr:hypothetical protein PFISCL1PPCAC_6056 [Pristionchus fissidentatus]
MAFYFALMNVSNKKERRLSSSRPVHSSTCRSFYDTSPTLPSAPSNSFESLSGSFSQGEGTPNSGVPSSTASFPPPVRTSKKVTFKPPSPSPSIQSSSSSTTTRNYFLGSRRVSRLSQRLIPFEFVPRPPLVPQFSLDSSLSSFHRGKTAESIEVRVQNEFNARIEQMERGKRMDIRPIETPIEKNTVRDKNTMEEVMRDQEGDKWRDEGVKVNWIRKNIGENGMNNDELHFINHSFIYLEEEKDWFMSMANLCPVY